MEDRERIAERISTLNLHVSSWNDLDTFQKESWAKEADQILILIKELGYRKPGRLLTPEERKPYWHDYKEGHWHIEDLLQAQLDQRGE